jgi:hypothetical protein
MNMRWSIRFLILALACGMIPADDGNESAGLTVGDRAPDFVLADADDRQHSLSQLGQEGKAVLLIMGNRKTRKEHEKWAEAFRKEYGDRKWITSYIVLDMRSAPAFAPKSLIKRKLAKNRPPATVLLDWKGKVHRVYRTQKQTPNLYLVRPGGRLTFHLNANFDPESYLQLEKAIDDLRNRLHRSSGVSSNGRSAGLMLKQAFDEPQKEHRHLLSSIYGSRAPEHTRDENPDSG